MATNDCTLTYSFMDAPPVTFTPEAATIEDTFEKVIAKYEFPYRDGALLEDMGQRARAVRLRLFFYNETYDTHKVLLNYLATQDGGSWELNHPAYGLIKGYIESVIPRHDQRERTAEIDLIFIENLRGVISPEPEPSADQTAEGTFQDGQDELTNEMHDDMCYALGSEGAQISAVTLDPTKNTYFEQFSGLSKQGQAYVRQVDLFVRRLQNTLATIANPANSLVSTISYGTNLPGATIGAVARCVERYALAFVSLVDSPMRFQESFCQAINDLEDAAEGFGKYVTVAGSQRSCSELASCLGADRRTALALQRAASVRAFSPNGALLTAVPSPELPLSADEVEAALATSMGLARQAVDAARNVQTIKRAMAALVQFVVQAKKEQDRIRQVVIGNPTPLHLICLNYGLPYGYADALLTINRIRNPNFVTGAVNVYAR